MSLKRRPTTYGKIVRKHAVDVDFAAFDEHASQYNRTSKPQTHQQCKISASQSCAQHDEYTSFANLLDTSAHTPERKSTAITRFAWQPVSATPIRSKDLEDCHGAEDIDNRNEDLRHVKAQADDLKGRTVKRRKLTSEAIHSTDIWRSDDKSSNNIPRRLNTSFIDVEGFVTGEAYATSRHKYAKPVSHSPDRSRRDSAEFHDHCLTSQSIEASLLCAQNSTGSQSTLSIHATEGQGAVPCHQSLETGSDTSSSAEVLSTPMDSPKRKHSPSTPSAVASPRQYSMTPRQRDSWSKLLGTCTSPNILDDTSSLVGKEEGANRKHRSAVQIPSSFNSATADPVRSDRSARLVDLLTVRRASYVDDSSSDQDSHTSSRSDDHTKAMSLMSQTLSSADAIKKNDQIDNGCSILLGGHKSMHSETVLKITYARDRSYLNEGDMINEKDLCDPVSPCPQVSRRIQHPSGSRIYNPGTEVDQEDNSYQKISQGHSGVLRSVHELRRAGGNTRLTGELEAILDDLEDQQTSSFATPHTCLVNLMLKLRDRFTCRLFVDKGYDARIATYLSFLSDPIQRALAVAVILQILAHSTSTFLLSCIGSAKMQAFWDDLLVLPDDLTNIAKTQEIKMSKLAQREFYNTCEAILDSSIWRLGRPAVLSSQILALQALDTSSRQCREAGASMKMLSPRTIHLIALTATKVLDKATRDTSNAYIGLELALSLLEMSTFSGSADRFKSEWSRDTHERIKAILPALSEHSSECDLTTQVLALRLYLNLTNNDTYISEMYSGVEVVSALLRINSRSLDALVLSLGCLINLAEISDGMRQSVLSIKLEGSVALELLLQTFAMKRQHVAEVCSEEEAGFNVAYGYLAVLLSYLSKNRLVRSVMVAGHSAVNLSHILDAVSEFLLYHQQVEDDARIIGSDPSRRTDFIIRLQTAMDELRSTQ